MLCRVLFECSINELFVMVKTRSSEEHLGYFEVLWAFILVSAPYLVGGLAISGIIHEFVPMEKVKKWLGAKKASSIFKAALVGVPLPLCSCSVIPTAVTLRKGGASNGATSAFLISTPESGVDSISMTYGLMDLPMTILRPIAAFASAFFAGMLQLFFNDYQLPETEQEVETKSSCCSKKSEPQKKSFGERVKNMFNFGFGKLMDDIAAWLTIGILLGAMIEFVVPENFFTDMGMISNRFMILLIGIPLYICASASTPIAVSLMLKGLSPGSAILFLLVGPATNISNIAVLQKFIGKKGVAINIFSIAFVALLFSFLVDFLYQNYFTLQLNQALAHHDHHGHVWWENVLGILFVVLLLKGVYQDKIKPKLNSGKQAACH